MRTTEALGLMRQRPANLLSETVCGEGQQAWNALAEIGRQLQILAGAQSGQGNFSGHPFSAPAVARAVTLTVVELVNLFLLTKAKAGKSDRYLRALRYTIKKFVAGRAHVPADDVTVEDVEKWMRDLKLSPRTQRGYLGDVRTLYNFGIRRGVTKTNPARGVELPELELEPVKIFTPETVRRILKFARAYDLDICRALAIRFFAGVRTVEAERMDESLIGEKYIEITRDVCKGARARRRRLILIQPNLRAWLNIGGELPAPKQNGRKMLEFMRALNEDWPANVTRHSFCSHHLAKFGDIKKLILESGHTEQMLFGNYREVVTPEQGTEYFDIFPETDALV